MSKKRSELPLSADGFRTVSAEEILAWIRSQLYDTNPGEELWIRLHDGHEPIMVTREDGKCAPGTSKFWIGDLRHWRDLSATACGVYFLARV